MLATLVDKIAFCVLLAKSAKDKPNKVKSSVHKL